MRKVIILAGLWVKLKMEKQETSYMWCGVSCSPVTVDNVSEVISPDLYRLIISSDTVTDPSAHITHKRQNFDVL
jgi:hypothetical protein